MRVLVVRGDGPARGLDRPALGPRRRRQRHPHPRAALRRRPGLRAGSSPASRPATPRSWSSPRARCPRTATLVLKDESLDSFGHVRLSGVGEWLAKEIERRTGKEARTTVLGHVQRGGTPSAFDRWLATRFGLHAIDAVRDGDFGKMVALRGTDIVRVPLAEATAKLKTVDPALYEEVGGLLRLTPPPPPGPGGFVAGPGPVGGLCPPVPPGGHLPAPPAFHRGLRR